MARRPSSVRLYIFAQIASSRRQMAESPPNLHTMDSRSACIQVVLKVKVKVKGHVIRALFGFLEWATTSLTVWLYVFNDVTWRRDVMSAMVLRTTERKMWLVDVNCITCLSSQPSTTNKPTPASIQQCVAIAASVPVVSTREFYTIFYLRNRRWGGYVYVLQMFFLFFFYFARYRRREVLQSVCPQCTQCTEFVWICTHHQFSQANGQIATKLAHDGLQVSLRSRCAQDQG